MEYQTISSQTDENIFKDTATEKQHCYYDSMNLLQRLVKRGFDFFGSLACLILLSWLFLIIYILIRKEDGGHAFFKQERIGKGGRPFYIYKFRTMKENSEGDNPQLVADIHNERLTSIGKRLRAHHLDELPQLINVIRGEMSFVGYRPERKYFIDQILLNDPRYIHLYEIQPGVTSEATLYNGYTDTMEKMLTRLDKDLYYLENRNLFMDMRIFLATVFSVVSGRKF